jgi:hypothetical protein
MRHPIMIMAGAWTVAATLLLGSAFCSAARADELYWVVGNRASARCEIVTSNPVIIGDIWFADGPYRSRADAKLARSTIGACPKPESDED